MSKLFLSLSVAIISATTICAQDTIKTKQLDEVVVTATKFPIKQSLTGKVVTVIGKEQLEKSSGRTLTEVLNTQAGLIVNGSNNTLGTNQQVFVRGAGSGKTLILIDGIPVYDPSGISSAFDLNLISIDQVERVEILKGSQSTLYGSDAIAGVINIITKKGSGKKFNGTANIAAGSYGTWKATAGADGKINNTTYNVQFTKLKSDGFSAAYDQVGNKNFDKDGFDKNAFRVNLGQKINKDFSVKGYTQLSKYKADIDAGAFADDADYTFTNKNSQAGFGANYSLGKSVLHFNYNYNVTNRTYLDDSASRGGFAIYSKGEYNCKSHFIEAYSNWALSKKTDLLVGADYRTQVTDQKFLSISSFGPFSTALGDSARVKQLGVYASLVLKNFAGFNMEAGGRYNQFDKYGNVFTFSFNPSYVINDEIKIFGNITSGFKAPTLFQVYSQYRNPFGELKPEKSLSVEGGVQYNKQNINLRAVYFIRNVKDNIVFYSAGAPTWQSYYLNADEQKDKGLELEANLSFGKLNLSANYTNLDGEVFTKIGTKDSSYFNLFRRPRQVVNLNAGVQATNKIFINFGVQTIGKRLEAIWGAAPVEMPAYYVWNVYADYKLVKQVKAFVNLKNITDEKYFDVRGYNSRRFNFMAGLNVNF